MMSGGAHRLAGPVVILEGPALLHARHLLAMGVQVLRQRDGITPPAQVVELVRTVAAAAEEYRRMAPAGHGDAAVGASEALSEAEQTRTVCTTAEAAVILRLSVRQVRRLDLARVSPPGAALLFDRAYVEAYAAERAA